MGLQSQLIDVQFRHRMKLFSRKTEPAPPPEPQPEAQNRTLRCAAFSLTREHPGMIKLFPGHRSTGPTFHPPKELAMGANIFSPEEPFSRGTFFPLSFGSSRELDKRGTNHENQVGKTECVRM